MAFCLRCPVANIFITEHKLVSAFYGTNLLILFFTSSSSLSRSAAALFFHYAYKFDLSSRPLYINLIPLFTLLFLDRHIWQQKKVDRIRSWNWKNTLWIAWNRCIWLWLVWVLWYLEQILSTHWACCTRFNTQIHWNISSHQVMSFPSYFTQL